MASFSSDEEIFEVDSILEQRKKKGILHYLVQWKEGDATWEPAERIAKDCAAAIEAFVTTQKSRSRRSSSKSRKSSRSRSRSQSRSRKGSTKAVRRSSRSRSRGRQLTESAASAATKETTKVESKIQTRRSLPDRKEAKAVEEVKINQEETKSVQAAALSLSSSSSSTPTSVRTSPSKESNSADKSESQLGSRTLRSSTMEARKKLEVQRVHNEQRPVREDDNKPRSAIWRVADYAVIALFIISVIAALFMFLEKFMDLENFKKQAFPSFETLSLRLHAAKDHLVEFFQYGWDCTSDGWDYILQQVKPAQSAQPVPSK